jgi:hypothetical protein
LAKVVPSPAYDQHAAKRVGVLYLTPSKPWGMVPLAVISVARRCHEVADARCRRGNKGDPRTSSINHPAVGSL